MSCIPQSGQQTRSSRHGLKACISLPRRVPPDGFAASDPRPCITTARQRETHPFLAGVPRFSAAIDERFVQNLYADPGRFNKQRRARQAPQDPAAHHGRCQRVWWRRPGQLSFPGMGAFAWGRSRRQNASPSRSTGKPRTSRQVPRGHAGVHTGTSSHSSAGMPGKRRSNLAMVGAIAFPVGRAKRIAARGHLLTLRP